MLPFVDEASVGCSLLFVSPPTARNRELHQQFCLNVHMAEQNFHLWIRTAERSDDIVHNAVAFSARPVTQLEATGDVDRLCLGNG